MLSFCFPLPPTTPDVTLHTLVTSLRLDICLLYWPLLEPPPFGRPSLAPPQRRHLTPPLRPYPGSGCQPLLKNSRQQPALVLGQFVLPRPRKIRLLLPQNRWAILRPFYLFFLTFSFLFGRIHSCMTSTEIIESLLYSRLRQKLGINLEHGPCPDRPHRPVENPDSADPQWTHWFLKLVRPVLHWSSCMGLSD